MFHCDCKPENLNYMSFSCLMFADDLLLLSESAEGLRKSLEKLL